MLTRTLSLHGYYIIVGWCMEVSENQELIWNLAMVTWLPHLVHHETIAS